MLKLHQGQGRLRRDMQKWDTDCSGPESECGRHTASGRKRIQRVRNCKYAQLLPQDSPEQSLFRRDQNSALALEHQAENENMNTELMFSSKSDLWETPQDLFDELDKEFHFNLDVCALPENTKCAAYYTPEIDGLSQPWYGRCWCNPPYGRGVGAWVQKAALSALAGATVVMLLPARTDTKWFHDYIYKRAEIRFIRGRLKFGGCSNSAPFPSMVCIWGS